jgi:RES domain
MSDGLASVESDGPLYRLGRYPDPWAWPDWSYAAPDGTFGNRYDDPQASYRVLYASSQRVGAFLETLARFRPDLEVLAELDRIEGDDEPPPAVPRSWLDKRLLGEARVEGRFVDVGDTTSLATLRMALAASAIRHGLDEIDAATIRLRAPRAFTQQVSRFVYEQRDDRGAFAGLRYRSRLGDEIINWALFEPAPDAGSPFVATTAAAIEADDPDLEAALGLLGLTIA